MDQTLSPSSSEIMRRATVLVDKLLLKTSNNGLTGKIIVGNNPNSNENGEDNNIYSTNRGMEWTDSNELGNCSDQILNIESNSLTGSDALSALNSARRSVPSIEMIKKLAGRLKNRDSDTISEINFSKMKHVFLNSGIRNECSNNNESVSNYRSKSASPVSSELNRKEAFIEFNHNFAQLNKSLSELNKRVENLSSNIDDIHDSDYNELNVGNGEDSPTFNQGDIDQTKNVNRRINMRISEDDYFSQASIAFLQQERIKMWTKDNEKYSASINSSENLNESLETDHIPFSNVYYSKKYLEGSANDITGSGVINSSILSTTASGAAGQFAHSNDTTVYEFGSNGRNSVSEVPELCIKSNKQNFESETAAKRLSTTNSSSYNQSCKVSFEPKTLRFIRVGNQLRRSITVTPLVESLQEMLSRSTGTVYNPGLQSSKMDKLTNHSSPYDNFQSSSYTGGYSPNIVIVTVENERDRRNGGNAKFYGKRKDGDTFSTRDSDDSSEGGFLFSCRECSWNPVYACPIQ